jgi:hypothetical protein
LKIRDLFPDLEKALVKDFLEKLNMQTIFEVLPKLVDYYNSELKLWQVLNHYGNLDLYEDTEAQQVPCLLPEHGTEDKKNSAKYFNYDRDTGELSESVYCYKCCKKMTAFWFVYSYEKESNGKNLIEVLIYLDQVFKISLPKNIFLDYDAEQQYSWDAVEENESIVHKFKYMESIRITKYADINKYVQELEKVLIG